METSFFGSVISKMKFTTSNPSIIPATFRQSFKTLPNTKEDGKPSETDIQMRIQSETYTSSSASSRPPSLHCLICSPLVQTDGSVVDVIKVDVEAERVTTSLRKIRPDASLSQRWASANSLRHSLLTGNFDAVLIGAHCQPHALILDTITGVLHPVGIHELDSMLKNTFSTVTPPRVVVINACHSAEIGKCFARAGVPHVVAFACGESYELHDLAAETFSEFFFESLGSGAKVQDAFDAGVGAVRLLSGVERFDAAHYKLLPEKGDHNEIIWPRSLGSACIQTCPANVLPSGNASPKAQLPPVSQTFANRNLETHRLLILLIQEGKRFVVLYGEPRVGKTEFAKFVALCVQQRFSSSDVFKDGVRFIRFLGHGVDDPTETAYFLEELADVDHMEIVPSQRRIRTALDALAHMKPPRFEFVVVDGIPPNLMQSQRFLELIKITLEYSPKLHLLFVSEVSILNLEIVIGKHAVNMELMPLKVSQ